MIKPGSWFGVDRKVVAHSLRTAIAAIVSLCIARLFKLPEAYWACITTLIVMQSDVGTAWTASWQRLAGTALGAALGALVEPHFGPNIWVFAACIFLLGLLCALLHLPDAYRMASVTLALVLLIARKASAWEIARDRFLEVSIGIAIGLVLTALWTETPSDKHPAADDTIHPGSA